MPPSSRAPDGDVSSDALQPELGTVDRPSLTRISGTVTDTRVRREGLVRAATRLLREKGADFTIQDVANRAGVSRRALYTHFASKEDLMLAVYERALAREAMTRVRSRIEEFRDPLLRLRAYVETLLELAAESGPGGRTLANFQDRLAEGRSRDLERAMTPLFDLLVRLIADVSSKRKLQPGLTVEGAARLMERMVMEAARRRALGAKDALDIPARAIWQFCASAVWRDGGSPSGANR